MCRKLCRVQATVLEENEEKVVVEETFQPTTLTGNRLETAPESSSSNVVETWAIKLEQSVNVFLTVKFLSLFVVAMDDCSRNW